MDTPHSTELTDHELQLAEESRREQEELEEPFHAEDDVLPWEADAGEFDGDDTGFYADQADGGDYHGCLGDD